MVCTYDRRPWFGPSAWYQLYCGMYPAVGWCEWWWGLPANACRLGGFMSHATPGGEPETPDDEWWTGGTGDMSQDTGVELGVGLLPTCWPMPPGPTWPPPLPPPPPPPMYPPVGLGWLPDDEPLPVQPTGERLINKRTQARAQTR